MDNAVALVEAYLHLNGYFTVAEYPVVEAMKDGGIRVATDLDILAFRFSRAGLSAFRRRTIDLDAALGVGPQDADMLIGEVKEGRAELNQAATDPAVLRAALIRFGCCQHASIPDLVKELLRSGAATTPGGHRVRMVAFGSLEPGGAPKHRVILLGQIVEFLREYIRRNWEVVRHADFKDPAFGFLMALEKAARGLPRTQTRAIPVDRQTNGVRYET